MDPALDSATLCSSANRDDQPALDDFNAAVLEQRSGAIEYCLQSTYCLQSQLMPRVTHATKETSRDLRSIVIWNFVDLYAAQLSLENKPIGLAGVAKKINVDRNTLSRYHRNCNTDSATLKSASVVGMELKILAFLDSIAFSPSGGNPVKVTFRINGQSSGPFQATGCKSFGSASVSQNEPLAINAPQNPRPVPPSKAVSPLFELPPKHIRWRDERACTG
jgi:hypothetical protein